MEMASQWGSEKVKGMGFPLGMHSVYLMEMVMVMRTAKALGTVWENDLALEMPMMMRLLMVLLWGSRMECAWRMDLVME